MKKIILCASFGIFFLACNPNSNDTVNTRDTTNYGNAGMSGTTNANGVLPVDSNRSVKTIPDSLTHQRPAMDSTHQP